METAPVTTTYLDWTVALRRVGRAPEDWAGGSGAWCLGMELSVAEGEELREELDEEETVPSGPSRAVTNFLRVAPEAKEAKEGFGSIHCCRSRMRIWGRKRESQTAA